MTLHFEREFRELMALPDTRLPLFDAAVLVAREEYPENTLEECRSIIGDLAAQARPRVSGDIVERYAALGRVMFDELGFLGNRDDYYNPLNSYIPHVLERRMGIPITLALVFIEIARELGLAACGVGFPGHFLIRHAGSEEIILDPFTGELLSRDECRALLGEARLNDTALEVLLTRSSNRAVLVRLVSNLKHSYMLKAEHARALRACELILMLDPLHAPSYRDRGLVHEKLELFRRAEADLRRYLELAPEDTYAPAITEHLAGIRNKLELLN